MEDRLRENGVDECLQANENPVRRLLTPLLSKSVPPLPADEERPELPMTTTNYVSQLLFLWLIPMLRVGYKRTLQQNDLWVLDRNSTVDTKHEQFNRYLQRELGTKDFSQVENEKLSWAIVRAYFKTFKTVSILAVLYKILAVSCASFTTVLVKKLITIVQRKQLDPDMKINEGIGYTFGLSLLLLASSLFYNQSALLSRLMGGHSRTIFTKQLLEKSLVANDEARHVTPNGKLLTLLNSDLSRIDFALEFFPIVCSTPFPVIIGVTLLLINIGVSSLVGLGVFALLMVATTGPATLFFKYRIGANQLTDDRVSALRELLLSMKMIKFYTWEDAYSKIITAYRSKEISYVLKLQYVMSVLMTLFMTTPQIISMVSFLVLFTISHGQAANIFASLILFNILAEQVSEFPAFLMSFADALTAVKRVAEYLRSSEEQPMDYDGITDDLAISVKDADFVWKVYKDSIISDDEKKGLMKTSNGIIHEALSIFKGVNLEIKKGEFIVITGPIGSGKTSLLSAIFGLMNKTHGSVGFNGSMVFSGQPWVQNATVKENIIFGSDFDEKFYGKVLDACALYDDLKLLSAGDFTEIGERGVTLSGGQKARINLARAVYANRDIYLLDDVLSAVDAKVGNHIVDSCLVGLLKNKTRILATHQLSLIHKADRVVFLKDGHLDIGTEEELKARNKAFVELLEYNRHLEEKEKDDKEEDAAEKKESEVRPVDGTSLFKEEERAVNSIPFRTYLKYLKAGEGVLGRLALPLLLTLFVLNVVTTLLINVWLSFWIEKKFGLSKDQYIGLYIFFGFFNVVLSYVKFSLFAYILVTASKVLNLKALEAILHTPMQYLDTTPLGRIINRFTKDTNSLDNEIERSLVVFCHDTAQIIGIIILTIIYLPWFAISVPFTVGAFITVANYYQASAREVKRLEAINRSFLLSNFNEVLGGMSTIKAYNAVPRFLARNSKFSDMMNEVYFVVNANQRWISVTLDSFAAVLVLLTSLLTVTAAFKLSPSSAGLLTSYMINMAGMFPAVLTLYTQTENEMNSVERVIHYAYELEQEAPYKIEDTKPPAQWPVCGAIKFTDVSLRYREGLPLIFKNLSFKVRGGEKVGICGRTGAGKSSLMTALYRIVELANGKIEIDGIDISKLGLFELRSKLSIIPQDPVLFKGSIRKNLDPFGESDDEKLWDALRRSGVFKGVDYEGIKGQKNGVNLHKFHLDALVVEDGANFSLGEKQLIALARALVRDTKILIMDEATSSVDYETDALVQETIKNEFSDCTVLSIAHRLRTIVKNDKILVLEKGELGEFDTPKALFERGGIFKQMCDASKITKEDFI